MHTLCPQAGGDGVRDKSKPSNVGRAVIYLFLVVIARADGGERQSQRRGEVDCSCSCTVPVLWNQDGTSYRWKGPLPVLAVRFGDADADSAVLRTTVDLASSN